MLESAAKLRRWSFDGKEHGSMGLQDRTNLMHRSDDPFTPRSLLSKSAQE
jgi:hypothetical protein